MAAHLPATAFIVGEARIGNMIWLQELDFHDWGHVGGHGQRKPATFSTKAILALGQPSN